MAQWWRRDAERCTRPDENGHRVTGKGTWPPGLPLFREPHSLSSWRFHEDPEESLDIAAISDPRERSDDLLSSHFARTSSAARSSSSDCPARDSRSTAELDRESIHYVRNFFRVQLLREAPKDFRGWVELLRDDRLRRAPRLQDHPSQGWTVKFVWKQVQIVFRNYETLLV